MTTLFIKKFKLGISCRKCNGPGVTERKMCNEHRGKARDHWRIWVPQRKAMGKCIACSRKPYNGFQRCRACTLQNRKKCLKWMAAHPSYSIETWSKRKAVSLRQGTCAYCRDHNPVYKPGALKCEPCLVKGRNQKRES